MHQHGPVERGEHELRVSGVVLSFAVCALSQPASAQDFVESLRSVGTEFGTVTKDVADSLHGMINKTSAEYTCLEVPLQWGYQLAWSFTLRRRPYAALGNSTEIKKL
jgi:hypothetical protein